MKLKTTADKGSPRREHTYASAKRDKTVIRVTRLNGHPIILNSDLVKFIERSPDTVITLTNGEKLIVREDESEVVELIKTFRQSMMAAAGSGQGNSVPQPSAINLSSEGRHRG